MKRIAITLFLALAAAFSAMAQDVITCIDGSDIIAQVIEVGAERTVFQYPTDPEAPSQEPQAYALPNDSILMIRYLNGECVIFPAGYAVLEELSKAPVPEPYTPAPAKKKRCCLFRCCRKNR